jgi:hypothetical protein
MPIEWVTGPDILAHWNVRVPSPEDSTWAELCASAVNAGIGRRLEDVVLVFPIEPVGSTMYAELRYAAVLAGAEAYKRREAAFGVTGYSDLQGIAIRVARDYLETVSPIIARYASFGFA